MCCPRYSKGVLGVVWPRGECYWLSGVLKGFSVCPRWSVLKGLSVCTGRGGGGGICAVQ